MAHNHLSTALKKFISPNLLFEKPIDMSGKKTLLPPQANLATPSSSSADDEVNFLELLEVLIRKKTLIFFIFSAFTLLSIGYCMWTKPVYRASISFLPSQSYIASELIPKSLLSETKESLYEKYLTRIQSYTHQKDIFDSGDFFNRFIDNANATITPDKASLSILGSITIAQNSRPEIPTLATIMGSKPEAMADFLNILSRTAIKNIQTETSNLLQTKINNRLKVISEERNLLKKEANTLKQKQLRKFEKEEQNRLQVLKKKLEKIEFFTEELRIARELNIRNNNFHLAVPGSNQPKWYLYGELVLEKKLNSLKRNLHNQKTKTPPTELKKLKSSALQKRIQDIESNSWYKVRRMEELTNETKTLKAINVSTVKPQVALISKPSTPPTNPVKPKKRVVILLGMLFGLFTGIITAFISNSLANLKNNKNSSSLT